jgi:ammonium transporter, Amt family
LNQNRALIFCFDAFSSREPVSTSLENALCTPNSGDTAWMLTSVALVLMMTIPGLGLFYGGMVRKQEERRRHVMTSFAITCLVTVLWTFFTYSLAFRAGTPFIGGSTAPVPARHLSDIAKTRSAIPIRWRRPFPRPSIRVPDDLRDHHPGADRRRVRRAHEVLGDAVVHRLWAIFVYAPIAHWVWGPDGFLNRRNDAAWVKCSTSPAAPWCTSTPASPV